MRHSLIWSRSNIFCSLRRGGVRLRFLDDFISHWKKSVEYGNFPFTEMKHIPGSLFNFDLLLFRKFTILVRMLASGASSILDLSSALRASPLLRLRLLLILRNLGFLFLFHKFTFLRFFLRILGLKFSLPTLSLLRFGCSRWPWFQLWLLCFLLFKLYPPLFLEPTTFPLVPVYEQEL